jgi:hypothetical protein
MTCDSTNMIFATAYANGAPAGVIGTFGSGGAFAATGVITANSGGAAAAYYFGNTGTKYLSYDGTNFNLAGGILLAPQVNASGHLVATGDVYAGASGAAGIFRFGNTGTKYLQYDGTDFNLAGGTNLRVGSANVVAGGYYIAGGALATGAYFFGNTGTKYLQYDSANFNLIGGNLNLSNGIIFGGALAGSNGLDATFNTVTVGASGTICTLANFSGVVISTCWTSGTTEIIACGGGATSRIGGSSGANHTSSAYNSGAFGYSFFNNLGSTSTFGLMVLRTRTSA